jgi:putative methionine-R-sulfoxide reductase with GAF domain
MPNVFNYLSFLDETLKIICESVHAELGVIAYLENSEFIIKKAYGNNSKNVENLRMPKNKGFSGFVLKTGQGLIINDPQNDPRFMSVFDEKTGGHTNSILAIPLKYSDNTIGVMVLANKKQEKFNKEDYYKAIEMAAQAAISLQFAKYIEEIELYNRFNKCLTESLSGGLIGFDYTGKIITFNFKGAKILQLDRKNVLDRDYREAFSIYPEIVRLIETLIRNQQQEIRSMIKITLNDKITDIGYSKVLIQDESGKPMGGSISFQKLG